jgi:hypothetical protein
MFERYTRHKLCWTTYILFFKQGYKILSHDMGMTHVHCLSYNTDLSYILKFAFKSGLALSFATCYLLVSNIATVSLSNAANQLHVITIADVKQELE